MQNSLSLNKNTRKPFLNKEIKTRIKLMRGIYLLALLPVLHTIIFKYGAMYGIIIAFKDYNPVAGILKSPWNGFEHFQFLFTTPSLWQLVRNSLRLSFLGLIFGFPSAVVFAILINELRNISYKKVVQTISYLPHFLSWVVIGAMVKMLLSTDKGPINMLIASLGWEKIPFLATPNIFIGTLVVSDIWKNMGWGSIVYLAALTSINQYLYDASDIDGATRFQKIRYINIPSLVPVMTILLILRIGSIMDLSFDQIFNLYNPLVYDVADIFDTYVYRIGLINMQYDYSTAIGLFKTLVGLILLLITNGIVRKVSDYALW